MRYGLNSEHAACLTVIRVYLPHWPCGHFFSVWDRGYGTSYIHLGILDVPAIMYSDYDQEFPKPLLHDVC